MRYAILSDVHGRLVQLKAVLADAQVQGVDQIISLGDVGGDNCMALLQEAGAISVFGNYEVSGWRRLASQHRTWVRGWPALIASDSFLAVHAAPWWPDGLHSLEDFGDWLRRTGRSWRCLFPYVGENEGSLWQALVELETTDKAILFHGHTHQQTIWRWEPSGCRQQLRSGTIPIKLGHRYIVGVGSVGVPEDGGWAAYAYYDHSAGCVELVRFDRHPEGMSD